MEDDPGENGETKKSRENLDSRAHFALEACFAFRANAKPRRETEYPEVVNNVDLCSEPDIVGDYVVVTTLIRIRVS